MKKFFAVLLSLCLFLALPAFAEEGESIVSWNSDFEKIAESLGGGFFLVAETGLKMYVPEGFAEVPPTDAQLKQGIIQIFASDDGSVVAAAQKVAAPREAFKIGLMASGATEPVDGTLNGLDASSFEVVEDGVRSVGILVATGPAECVMITFAPFAEDTELLFAVMASSIMPA